MQVKIKADIASVQLLIRDEVSMLGRRNLGAHNVFLRKAKEDKRKFGGIILVFCGDFFQIPPVNAESVYQNPANSKRKLNDMDYECYNIWRSITNVVIQKENMRQMQDGTFGKDLKAIRRGQFPRKLFGD